MDRLKWTPPTTTVIRSQHHLSEEEKTEILKRKEKKESRFTKMDWDRALVTDTTPRLHLKAPVHSAVYIQQIAGLSEAPLVETAMADALGLWPEEMISYCNVSRATISAVAVKRT
ncbi:MAG: hypothetical protein M1815_005262 [Lichina confinis]|nr:MAG: hypothetical protein M1815_005262 [Lichina confinis]